MVGLCIRHWPAYVDARERFQKGDLGKLVSARFTRMSPDISGNAWENWFMKNENSGGALLDLHMHDVDTVHHFFGLPKAVTAFGVKGFRTNHGIDHVIGRFDYGNGSLVVAEGSWTMPKKSAFEMSFQIVGDRGTATLKADGTYTVIYENGVVTTPSIKNVTGWEVEIDVCINSILNPSKVEVDTSWLNSMKMVEAEEQSILKRKTVTL
ncbi:oxidoreductase family, NAD-binding Rossmann fold protein [Elysia marginata]|uniref:Oxidoreductase family, NAD-binding Rossmann fold protein n=1 Tax=Elysia marginata TaxID=1093978 RepID=A0AAV4GRV6_9GAST|nr:oxidoreductase family, NAD-binding Rossmann fold protein [Elysia marginata]